MTRHHDQVSITTHEQTTDQEPKWRSFVWRGGRTVATDLPFDRIAQELDADLDTRAWWFLPRDAGAVDKTADLLGLDLYAVEDVVGPRESPKLDVIGDTVLIVSAGLDFDEPTAELRIQRVSIVATQRVMVVIADEEPLARLSPLLAQCTARMQSEGIGAGVHTVVNALVGTYSHAVEQMVEANDALTASLFADKPLDRNDQLRAFQLRQAISHLRKIATPMVDVTADLASAARRPEVDEATDAVAALLGTANARRFADVADHAKHAADGITTLRETLNSAFETNLALSDVHLNMIMKKLSAWAAIIAVPTLITGFFGMNVPYPGFGQGTGFLIGLGIMITAVVTLFVLFRRNDWL
jgi:magnesium transporter